MKLFSAALLLSLVFLIESKYANYKIWKVTINSPRQYEVVKELRVTNPQSEVLSYIRNYGDSLDIMIPESDSVLLAKRFANASIQYEVKINNLQELINRSYLKTRTSEEVMDWTQYHNLSIIYDWMDKMAAKFPGNVSVFNIGKSYEDRDVKGLKISHKSGNKAVFIESNIHAREWITSASATWFINQLLHSQDPAIKKIAQNLDWYIIPVLNVDGFAFTHANKKNRLWRKSRKPNKEQTKKCWGVDMNRNFNFNWKRDGVFDNPCSQTYSGPKAASEPEVKELQDYLLSFPDNYFKIYISLHSYGQHVSSPPLHENRGAEQQDNIVTVAKGFTDALYQKYQKNFTYGASATSFSKGSGWGTAWAYGVRNITIPYTIELGDKGQYGLLLPPNEILNISRQFVDGIIGLVDACVKRNIIPSWM